jgi:hypothetical protein
MQLLVKQQESVHSKVAALAPGRKLTAGPCDADPPPRHMLFVGPPRPGGHALAAAGITVTDMRMTALPGIIFTEKLSLPVKPRSGV